MVSVVSSVGLSMVVFLHSNSNGGGFVVGKRAESFHGLLDSLRHATNVRSPPLDPDPSPSSPSPPPPPSTHNKEAKKQ